MDATGKIAPQAWMTAPATRALVAAIEAGGEEVRFIGGCVRDALLKRRIKDIDLATPLAPEAVMALLEAAGIRVVPTGLAHGTVTAVIGETHFEVTTLRVDVETDGRRARVAFTDDWEADAARRDFTINTLSCTPGGDVFDPFGGLEDLAHGRVRFVGNPTARIEEDVLRLLRFFRFHAHYGRPPPDTAALAACRALAHRLVELSGERVRSELFNILMAPQPADVILLMRGERVLERILPEAGEVGRLRLLAWLETTAIHMDTVGPEAVRRLGALLDTDGAGAAAVADRLRLSKRQKARLVAIAQPPRAVDPEMGGPALRRALHRAGAEAIRDGALVAWAAERALETRPPPARAEAWRSLLDAVDAWWPRVFPLRGRDVLALGVKPGPRIKRLLAEVTEWWVEGDFAADREACLAYLAEAVAGGEERE